MESVKVLFISQEITPYLPESEMSVIARNLPQGVQERGREIRTFMPRFGCVNERRNQLHEVIRLSGMNLIIDDTDHPLIIKVASIQAARMQVYFIDNEDYFQRKALFTAENGTYFDDNDERCIFFCRGVLETVKKLRWAPDVIHCHGWFTSLIPIYIKKSFADEPLFSNAKVVTSIYDKEFPESFNTNFAAKVLHEGIETSDLEVVKNPTYNNLMKLAVNFSDAVIQGSEKISDEIIDYTKQNKKLFLPFQSADSYIDTYNQFYDSVLEQK
jgi:starch synthase